MHGWAQTRRKGLEGVESRCGGGGGGGGNALTLKTSFLLDAGHQLRALRVHAGEGPAREASAEELRPTNHLRRAADQVPRPLQAQVHDVVQQHGDVELRLEELLLGLVALGGGEVLDRDVPGAELLAKEAAVGRLHAPSPE